MDYLVDKGLLDVKAFPIEGNGIHMFGTEADGFMLGSARKDLENAGVRGGNIWVL